MYINTIFIGYLAAMFLSLLCLALILLVLARKDFGREKNGFGEAASESGSAAMGRAARNFAVMIFLTGCLYFIFYYRETVQNKFELALPFRIADYTLCCMLLFTWFLLLRYLTNSEKNTKMVRVAAVFTISRIAISIIMTSLFMGPYYNIENRSICSLWHGFEVLFVIISLFLLVRYCIDGYRNCSSKVRRRYMAACTGLLAAMDAEQSFIEMGLAAGKYGISAWELETPDMTGVLVFALSLVTLLFVFKEDFSPLFFIDCQEGTVPAGPICSAEAVSQSEDMDREIEQQKKLDFLAQEYGLTAREREVIGLLYEGCTNPEISQELYISVNTVKKHLQHTYEKLGVNSRMEVLRLINEQNYPVG